MTHTFIVTLLATLVLVPVPGMAQTAGGGAGKAPPAASSGGGGGGTGEGRSRWIAEKFEHMDANGDGRITRAEFDEAVRAWADKQFVRADKDQSGDVTRQEFDAVIQEMRQKRAEHRKGKP